LVVFWHGCNYPWSTDGTTIYYGLDFGGNVWGSHLGVSTRRAAIERDFADIAALGFSVVRWFVFGDGRAGIVYDDGGLPAALDPHFFVDLDAGLEIARANGIRIDLVLLDHRWMFEGVRETIADPATGALFEARLPHGRARVLQSPAGRAALFTRVLEPMVRRYGTSGARGDLADSLFAFELMNEPDFVVEEWERDLSSHVARPLKFEILAEIVARLSGLVHQLDRQLRALAQSVGLGRRGARARRAAGAFVPRRQASGAGRRHLRQLGRIAQVVAAGDPR
jgi:hypothetical protein